MRRVVAAVLLAGAVFTQAEAQDIEWGKAQPDKAVVSVIVPAAMNAAAFNVTDKSRFADVIAARSDQPVVKTYFVDPGTYDFYAGNAPLVTLKLDPGSVHLVAYDPEKTQLFTETFESAKRALASQGAANWVWLGQETIDPTQNKIFISSGQGGGTDDAGPSFPQDQQK